MPSEPEMKAALQKYIDAFVASDADALAALFADDATVEDPVGSETLRGKEAIAAFYRKAVRVVTHMALSAPIRGSHGNAAAMAFDFEMNLRGRKVRTSAIDVMEFDDDRKIKAMRAYWGPSDSKTLGPEKEE
jgi:steroid delta-isomerase